MVDPVGDQIFPISPIAFQAVSAPVSRVLARSCVALFLGENGHVFRIETIKLTRRGPIATVKTWLGRPEKVNITCEAVDAPLDDIRIMMRDAVTYTRQRNLVAPVNWWVYSAPEGEVHQALDAAKTLSELHAALRVPESQHCLAIL